MDKVWNSVEHKVFRALKPIPLKDKILLVAVSGGADSMALLTILNHLKKSLKFEIKVIHIHHGGNSRFRHQAQKFVFKIAKAMDLTCETNIDLPSDLKSEAALRRYRYKILDQAQKKYGAVVATGHHAQDLLETQLINCIRGSSFYGLQSLSFYHPQRQILRPLLGLSKNQILEYCRERRVKFLNDPSNRSKAPLRNWIRHDWLPRLEKKRRGSVTSLARSFNLLSQSKPQQRKTLDREKFKTWSPENRAHAIVELIRSSGISNYTKGHIEEILRRLDTPQKTFTFRTLDRNWSVTHLTVKICQPHSI